MALRVNSLQRFRARAFQWRIVLLNLLLLFWGGTGLAYATHAETIHEAIGYDSHGTLIQPGEEGKRPQPRSQRPLVVAADVESSGAGDRNILAEAVSPTPLPPAPEQTPLVYEEPGDSDRNDSTQRSVIGLTPEGDPEPESTFTSNGCSPANSQYVHVRRVPPSIEWLSDHQNREGYWSSRDYDEDTKRPDAHTEPYANSYRTSARSYGNASADLGVTGLALQCFIDAGYDHKAGSYRETVRQALLWLRKQQREDGSFQGARNLHDHSLVTMALCECYGLSGDQIVKSICDKAAKYLLLQRTPGSAWGQDARYTPDLESTWYAVLALKSARMSGLEVQLEQSWIDVGAFLDLMAQDDETEISTHWNSECELEPGTTAYDPIARCFAHASWITISLHVGHTDLRDERIKRRATFLARKEHLPRFEYPLVDFRSWYASTLALFLCGGDGWETWEKPMADALLENRRGFTETDKANQWTDHRALREHGSWDPIDPSRDYGGRVYSTTMALRTLELYYHYLRLEPSK